MADNTTLNAGTGGDTIATDELATLNGSAASANLKVQRVKVGFGSDGDLRDVDSSNPLPTADADLGDKNDAAASSDAGTFSLIALFKRLLSKTAALLTTTPSQDAAASPVRLVGQEVITAGFSAVGASVLDDAFNAPIVGTGVGYSQAGGALLITTGTTANAEFLTRSKRAVRGSHRLRFTLTASQRIANQNLAVLMADLVGEGLTFTCVSATLVDVGIPSHTFTAQNVGQFCMLGGIVGAAGVPGRYAIASITDANTVRFTVAGWPASGSGTLTAFGRNYVRVLVNGTTATNAAVDAQRNGWATGDTTATINTTASQGTLIQAELTGREVFFSDALRASSTTPNFTTRASRYENIPDSTTDFYLFLWSYNGTSAPASTTTWTLGHASVESFPNVPVYLQGMRSQGAANPMPVAVQGTAAVSLATNTPTLAAGTNLAGDVGMQYRANATGAASIASVLSPATPAGASAKASAGRLLGWTLHNGSAGVRSVKIYNATAVTMGTTAAAFEIDIPAGGRAELQLPGGIGFATGIMWAVTSAKGLTDNTTTGLAANDVSGALFYA